MSSSVIVFSTSVSASTNIISAQRHIETVLAAKKISFETIDIAADSTQKDIMREKCNNEKAVPPQIFNGDHYCGDYKEFQEAVEEERVLEFLKM